MVLIAVVFFVSLWLLPSEGPLCVQAFQSFAHAGSQSCKQAGVRNIDRIRSMSFAETFTRNSRVSVQISSTIDEDKQLKRKIPFPFMEETFGLAGRWNEVSGNFVLEPPRGVSAVAVVHFLGGAFVGAAPHISYRFFLESLANQGFVIVTTPYRLDLDYLRICDQIVSTYDNAGTYLGEKYGTLPVVGVGHSCGALLHTLISSLFPDLHKDINVLLSFNNRPLAHSIPAFHELLVPLTRQLLRDDRRTRQTRDALQYLRRAVEVAVEMYSTSPLSPRTVSDEILPLLKQGIEVVDQVPPLLEVIADGRDEFSPSPAHTQDVIRRMYRTPKTLLMQFDVDSFDETSSLDKLLHEANTIMKMKMNRTLSHLEVERVLLDGTHITPLAQHLLLDLDLADNLPVPETYRILRQQFQTRFLRTVTRVSDVLGEYVYRQVGAVRTIPVQDASVSIETPVHSMERSVDSFARPQTLMSAITEGSSSTEKEKKEEPINFHSQTARERVRQVQERRRNTIAQSKHASVLQPQLVWAQVQQSTARFNQHISAAGSTVVIALTSTAHSSYRWVCDQAASFRAQLVQLAVLIKQILCQCKARLTDAMQSLHRRSHHVLSSGQRLWSVFFNQAKVTVSMLSKSFAAGLKRGVEGIHGVLHGMQSALLSAWSSTRKRGATFLQFIQTSAQRTMDMTAAQVQERWTKVQSGVNKQEAFSTALGLLQQAVLVTYLYFLPRV